MKELIPYNLHVVGVLLGFAYLIRGFYFVCN